jgi:hypothetical protein
VLRYSGRPHHDAVRPADHGRRQRRGRGPLSEIYHSVTGRSREEYYSTAIAILTIANIFAIVFAAVLDIIGKKYTWLSGEGELVRKASFKRKTMKKRARLPIAKPPSAWCYPPPASCWPTLSPKNPAKHWRRLYPLFRLDGADRRGAERLRPLLA